MEDESRTTARWFCTWYLFPVQLIAMHAGANDGGYGVVKR
jgi:hypothetical protein